MTKYLVIEVLDGGFLRREVFNSYQEASCFVSEILDYYEDNCIFDRSEIKISGDTYTIDNTFYLGIIPVEESSYLLFRIDYIEFGKAVEGCFPIIRPTGCNLTLIGTYYSYDEAYNTLSEILNDLTSNNPNSYTGTYNDDKFIWLPEKPEQNSNYDFYRPGFMWLLIAV